MTEVSSMADFGTNKGGPTLAARFALVPRKFSRPCLDWPMCLWKIVILLLSNLFEVFDAVWTQLLDQVWHEMERDVPFSLGQLANRRSWPRTTMQLHSGSCMMGRRRNMAKSGLVAEHSQCRLPMGFGGLRKHRIVVRAGRNTYAT